MKHEGAKRKGVVLGNNCMLNKFFIGKKKGLSKENCSQIRYRRQL